MAPLRKHGTKHVLWVNFKHFCVHSFRYLPDRESKKSGTNNLYLHLFAKEVRRSDIDTGGNSRKLIVITFRCFCLSFYIIVYFIISFFRCVYVCEPMETQTFSSSSFFAFYFKLLSLYPWRHSSTVTTRPTQHLSKEEIWRRRWHREESK